MTERPIELSIKEFQDYDKEKQEYIRQNCYVKVYNNFATKIKSAKNAGKTMYTIDVPTTYAMEKQYNVLDCAYYIVNRLQEGGFYVKYKPLRTIEVSWINEEIEKNKIKVYSFLTNEAKKPDPDIIIAPSIMWHGDKQRQIEDLVRENAATLKTIKLIKNKDEYIEASKKFLLSRD